MSETDFESPIVAARHQGLPALSEIAWVLQCDREPSGNLLEAARETVKPSPIGSGSALPLPHQGGRCQ